MAPDPNAPCRKAIFRTNTDKLPYNQNTLEGCAYCFAKRPPGGKPLDICSGCRSVRFCSREHQIKFWPSHKAFCKQQQKAHQALEQHCAHGLQHSCGLPPLTERKVILEDWTELHRRSVEQAMASVTHVKPIDFKKQYAHFTLTYRPESGGNPSNAFTLQSTSIENDPPSNTPLGNNFQIFRGMVDEADADINYKDDDDNSLLCLYVIDNEFPWLTALTISKTDLQKLPESKHGDWFFRLKYLADKGLVFRIVGQGKGQWMPGLMEKHGAKHWVWKQRTSTELADHDIHLPLA